MKLTETKKIGKRTYHFQFEGNNLYDVITEAQKLSFNDIAKCGCCGSENIILNARKAQDKYKYTEIKCLDCKGSLTFGQKQDDPDTFYLRKNEAKELDWKAYEAE